MRLANVLVAGGISDERHFTFGIGSLLSLARSCCLEPIRHLTADSDAFGNATVLRPRAERTNSRRGALRVQEVFHALLLELAHPHGLASFRIAPAAIRFGEAILESIRRRGEASCRALFIISREPPLRRDATREDRKRRGCPHGNEPSGGRPLRETICHHRRSESCGFSPRTIAAPA
jgi:hypothetical protein